MSSLTEAKSRSKNKSDPKLSVRALSELFHCGKTQISDILKDKEFITSLYESNASSSLSHTRHRTSDYSEINEALYKWYLLACSKNIYPVGTQLTEKAREIAVRLTLKEQTGGSKSGRNVTTYEGWPSRVSREMLQVKQ